MLKSLLCLGLALGGVAFEVSATTVQLKDKAAVTGKIIAEKRDVVAIDIGYTVLVIPRDQIIALLQDDARRVNNVAPAMRPVSSAAPASSTHSEHSGFYSAMSGAPKEHTVRELVNDVGEAVVQVRTPGGLGSGFFINRDGFLITNFHVTEGETQISVEVYQQHNGELERRIYKQVRIVAL